MDDPEIIPITSSSADLTPNDLNPSDRQMVRALTTIQSARTGVVVLRVIAGVVVALAMVGQALNIFWPDGDFNLAAISGAQRWALFLSSIAVPVAFAGLIVAASYVLEVYASRLDMDIVLAEMEEPED